MNLEKKSPQTEASPASPPEREELIRRRAYELFEARGRDDGHELDDWLQAENEVTAGERKTAAA